jgi:hypothetical protein
MRDALALALIRAEHCRAQAAKVAAERRSETNAPAEPAGFWPFRAMRRGAAAARRYGRGRQPAKAATPQE